MTPLQGYRKAVRWVHPAARCVRQVEPQDRVGFRIMVGARPLGDSQASIMDAWREADGLLVDQRGLEVPA